MNISLNSRSVLFRHGNNLKSTEEKEERQQKAQAQIDFFENQKANLRNMKCETLEEIGRKLELFNNYDAQIMAVKQQYNQEQMMHTMDEARELGEKIAEAKKKLEAKTPEERKREQIEEALGTEDEGGMLEELLDETMEKVLIKQEELAEEAVSEEEMVQESLEDAASIQTQIQPGIVAQEELTEEYLKEKYASIDIKV